MCTIVLMERAVENYVKFTMLSDADAPGSLELTVEDMRGLEIVRHAARVHEHALKPRGSERPGHSQDAA